MQHKLLLTMVYVLFFRLFAVWLRCWLCKKHPSTKINHLPLLNIWSEGTKLRKQKSVLRLWSRKITNAIARRNVPPPHSQYHDVFMGYRTLTRLTKKLVSQQWVNTPQRRIKSNFNTIVITVSYYLIHMKFTSWFE